MINKVVLVTMIKNQIIIKTIKIIDRIEFTLSKTTQTKISKKRQKFKQIHNSRKRIFILMINTKIF